MPISDQCLSNRFLKVFTVGALTTWCGRAFQWLTTLVLKNVFRTVVEHLGKNSFRLCPRKLCEPVANWKKDWLSTRSFPVRILNVSIRSPRSLLCCSEYSPKDFSRSSYDFLFNPLSQIDVPMSVLSTIGVQYLNFNLGGSVVGHSSGVEIVFSSVFIYNRLYFCSHSIVWGVIAICKQLKLVNYSLIRPLRTSSTFGW